ncbi:MAG: hypothetical protein ABIW38_00080 [Ferruginibacter sp.]
MYKIQSLIAILVVSISLHSCNQNNSSAEVSKSSDAALSGVAQEKKPVFDSTEYAGKMKALANGDTTGRWPHTAAFPLAGAILPYHRIVAYYGNLYSKKMGILGELPKQEMLDKLMGEVKKWEAADSSLPVRPSLHYVAITAQAAGDKKRMRMPFHQIDTIMNWAKEINALVFLDIQVGWSTLQEEIPTLEKYLQLPNVHLGIDPEFSMKFGDVPGKRIGTFDATDINYAISYLDNLAKKYNLPPKILIVHRFTQGMVTNAASIKPTPYVQVVMDMDGWGDKILKRSTWLRYIQKEPVQFTGFKLFYKNDTKKDPNGLYTPEELSKFIPKPIYIQYQ